MIHLFNMDTYTLSSKGEETLSILKIIWDLHLYINSKEPEISCGRHDLYDTSKYFWILLYSLIHNVINIITQCNMIIDLARQIFSIISFPFTNSSWKHTPCFHSDYALSFNIDNRIGRSCCFSTKNGKEFRYHRSRSRFRPRLGSDLHCYNSSL